MTACNWPSGREINCLSWAAALDVLNRNGAEMEPAHLEGLRGSDLRALVHRLKRESHESGACECSAAGYIRDGGGTARPRLPGVPGWQRTTEAEIRGFDNV